MVTQRWHKIISKENILYGLSNVFRKMSPSNIARQLLRSDSVLGPEASPRTKRGRRKMAGFSSWAGKRAARGQSMGFSSWAGKRAAGWDWKRAPFNSWAGKRSQGDDYY